MEWLKVAVDYGIIGLLVVMGVIAVSIVVEKILVYRNISLGDFDDKKSLEIELTKKMHIIATIG
ncbi:MAG: TonB-system energizer ExbB, partial [Thermodesulfovibrionales bacterium]